MQIAMHLYVDTAMEWGYMKIPPGILISAAHIQCPLLRAELVVLLQWQPTETYSHHIRNFSNKRSMSMLY